jgi:hypothetical protein
MWPDSQLPPPRRPPQLTPQLFIGLVVIALGLLMTFDNLGIVHAEEYIRFWPASLIGVGLLKLWHSRDGVGGAFGGFLFTVIGTWLLLEQTALVRLSFWDMWPTLLVFVGGFLVWQGLSRPRVESVAGDTTSTIQATAVLGAVVRGTNSPAFRGGNLTAVMGGCEIDLRRAAIDGEAVLEVFALWGGIELRVPEDWTVVSRISPIMGGIEDKTRPPQGATKHRLVIRGVVVMAGVEVSN